ncbi:MAG TPA: hypothetical protein VIM19_09860 [Actinomycetes bacterium]
MTERGPLGDEAGGGEPEQPAGPGDLLGDGGAGEPPGGVGVGVPWAVRGLGDQVRDGIVRARKTATTTPERGTGDSEVLSTTLRSTGGLLMHPG